MAKLKLRVPNLDAVPEALREYYKEVDGGFMVDNEADPDGYGIDNLAALRGKLDEAVRKKSATEAKLLTKEDGSLYTREEIEALSGELSEKAKLVATLQDKDKSTEEKFAERLRNERKPLEEKLAKISGERDGYREKVLSAERERYVDKIVDQLDPLPEWKGMIRAEVARHVSVEETAEGLQASIINPEDGKARFSQATGAEGRMGWEEFAKSETLRKPFGKCLAGDGKEGAGPVRADGGSAPRKSGADVVIRPGGSQAEFEAAWSQAAKSGGQVVMRE